MPIGVRILINGSKKLTPLPCHLEDVYICQVKAVQWKLLKDQEWNGKFGAIEV